MLDFIKLFLGIAVIVFLVSIMAGVVAYGANIGWNLGNLQSDQFAVNRVYKLLSLIQ